MFEPVSFAIKYTITHFLNLLFGTSQAKLIKNYKIKKKAHKFDEPKELWEAFSKQEVKIGDLVKIRGYYSDFAPIRILPYSKESKNEERKILELAKKDFEDLRESSNSSIEELLRFHEEILGFDYVNGKPTIDFDKSLSFFKGKSTNEAYDEILKKLVLPYYQIIFGMLASSSIDFMKNLSTCRFNTLPNGIKYGALYSSPTTQKLFGAIPIFSAESSDNIIISDSNCDSEIVGTIMRIPMEWHSILSVKNYGLDPRDEVFAIFVTNPKLHDFKLIDKELNRFDTMLWMTTELNLPKDFWKTNNIEAPICIPDVNILDIDEHKEKRKQLFNMPDETFKLFRMVSKELSPTYKISFQYDQIKKIFSDQTLNVHSLAKRWTTSEC